MRAIALLEPCERCRARGFARLGCVFASAGYIQAAIRAFGATAYFRMAVVANDNDEATEPAGFRDETHRATQSYPEPR